MVKQNIAFEKEFQNTEGIKFTPDNPLAGYISVGPGSITRTITMSGVFSGCQARQAEIAKLKNPWVLTENVSPEFATPVIGFHPDWIDENFGLEGTRKCFIYGNGTE